ncbi:hypothetical protein C8J57DRAFT_1094301 [Mycena rebaudengoi]|nr:hypothetical protein C8J57DRAFT_1094301 [Mycena rebaudengoi]
MSTKKHTVIAAEQSKPCRNDFARKVSKYPPEYLSFLNKTSKDDKTPARRRWRAKKGKRAIKQQKFVRAHQLTAEALLTVNGIAASTVVEGSMHRDQYLEFLEHQVVCECRF